MSSLYHNHYPPCTLHSELFHTPTNLYSLSITAIPFVHSHNAISHTLSSAYRPLSFSFFYLFRTHLVLQGPTQATDSWNPVLYLHKSICSFLWAPLSLYFILEFPTSSNHCCQYSPPPHTYVWTPERQDYAQSRPDLGHPQLLLFEWINVKSFPFHSRIET